MSITFGLQVEVLHKQVEALQEKYGMVVDNKTAAKIIGSTPATLNVWRHKGRGPDYVRNGRSIRYTVAALAEYLQRNTTRCT